MKRRTLISTALFTTLAIPAFAATTANTPMRKTENRIMSEKECWDLINEVEYAVVSTADTDGIPYGVPVSTAVTPDKKILFHGVLVGHGRKYENIKANPNVCLTFVREVDKREKGLNIQADSVVVQGKVQIVDDPDEKIKLMRVLLKPHNEQATAADIEAKLKKSELGIKGTLSFYVVTPTKVTGKSVKHKRIN